jgi:hypothetical protein
VALSLSHSLTNTGTGNLPEVKGGRWTRKADSLTAIYETIFLENVGPSTSLVPMELNGLLEGQLYFFGTS